MALAVAGGAIVGLGALLSKDPDRDDAVAADSVTADVLRLFGMSAADAADVCSRPLPDLDAIAPATPR